MAIPRTSPRATLAIAALAVALALPAPARAFNPDPVAAAVIAAEALVTVRAVQQQPKRAVSLPRRLQLAGGWFDFAQRRNVATLAVAQYFPGGRPRFGGAPFAGALVTTDGSRFGFGGLQYRLHLDRRWDATSGFGIGAYSRGAGKQLGAALEATFSLALSRRWRDGMRLRLEARHMSHDDVVSHYDPGADMLAVGLSIPLGR